MTAFLPIHLPQSGPNDVTATLVEWAKAAGHYVHRGEVVAVVETTKSVLEVEAPRDGFFYPLVERGSEAAVGAVIAALSPVETTVEAAHVWLATQQMQAPAAGDRPPAGGAKAATKKAELLAHRHHIDLAQVPTAGERIGEADVLAYLEVGTGKTVRVMDSFGAAGRTADSTDLVDDRYLRNRSQRLLIVGGGNGAVQIIDALARTPQQHIVAIMDDNTAIHGKTVAGVPVIGAIDGAHAADLLASGAIDAAVISVSTSIPFRERIFAAWKAQDIPFANVIHPSTVLGMNVAMGEGNVIMAFCHFGACATVGDNNFLSAYCSIEHHGVLGSHCSFGPGVVTSSRVHIGHRVRFGTGIYIEPGVTIGADSVVASGLAIWQNIPEHSLLKARMGYTVRSR